MDLFLQQFVNALSLGGTYALLALGLAVVFSVLGLINFAHGELMTLTGYAIFFALAAGLPYPVALVLGVLASTLSAIVMERIAFRPLRNSSATVMLLSSFAVAAMLHVLFQNLISARPKAIPAPQFLMRNVDFLGLQIGAVQLVSIAVTAISLLALTLFLRQSTLGIAMRAAASDFNVTRLMGINANLVISTAFAISGLLAGIAALLWLFQRGSVDPLMGFMPVLKAFIAAVLGGLGSLSGAVVGGLLLGFIEVGLRAYLPDGMQAYREAMSLAAVIAVLFFYPSGLVPRREAVR